MNKFPDHNVDPRLKKEKEWILKAGKAIWDNSKTFSSNIFYHGRHRFKEFRDYSNGRQSVDKYKNQIQAKDANGIKPEQFQQINWEVIPFIPKFKKIALGKINKMGYNLVATAIDALARDEEEMYFAEQKAKIRMLEELKDIPGIETMLDLGDDDPRTLEEVKIKQEYSYKHLAAIESEKALKAVFTANKYDQILERVNNDLFDYGVGGVREYFDPNMKIKIKHSNMSNFISSYCEEPDFSDATYMGEVIYMGIDEIQDYGEFTKDEIEDICNLKGDAKNWVRNNRRMPIDYEDNKIPVLDFEIRSFDEKHYEKRINKYGNPEIQKTRYGKRSKNEILKDGYRSMYRGKWIIGSDYVFDYGLVTNQKRKKNELKDTDFSWHLYAPGQDEMNFFGVIESMIPVADMIQLMWYRIQGMILNMVPPGVAFDLDALENIGLGHAGEEWKPRKVLEMYRQRGDFAYRSKGKDEGEQMNPEPIRPIANFVSGEIQNLTNIINTFLNLMRDNIGFNEVTDGSTPDPRMLNGVANMAYQSTSNALANIITAGKHLNENLADALVVRIQDAFAAGHKHYLKALGINSQRFWKVETDITVHELAIRFEDKPDDQQLQVINDRMNLALQSGQITVADANYLDTIDNIKEKAAVLSYLVRTNQERQQAMEMQRIQANAESQQQSAMVSSEMKQKELQTEYALKTQYLNQEKQWELRIEQERNINRIKEANTREQGRIAAKQVENQGKQRVKEMDKEI